MAEEKRGRRERDANDETESEAEEGGKGDTREAALHGLHEAQGNGRDVREGHMTISRLPVAPSTGQHPRQRKAACGRVSKRTSEEWNHAGGAQMPRGKMRKAQGRCKNARKRERRHEWS